MSSTTSAKPAIKTKTLVIYALFIALTLVATAFIQFRLPIMGNGGLIHLGNVPLFVAAFVYGRRAGMISGAFGMALFDLLSGWTAWAPFTFVIVGIMGYLAGLIADKMPGNRIFVYSFAVFAALFVKIVGYYFAEVILYGNWAVPLGSVPGNFLQVVVAGIVVVPLAERLRKSIGRI
ncbi:ECF transporter S component [Aciduricibacillus chroicocephali]|uniref:ECF transporter S component n=1 Tax=Aciduricibacillus chroicocephali TaxID=3054939 RepID=A0ABY9KWZ3_9BACI|nr:ECF transporter S component [Bacillaceae bacterium 44XB]